ncbi:MAG: hypothetical protein RL653_3599, partial [Pseudomonadota bacterium]
VVGDCYVSVVSAHFARCEGRGFAVSDRVAVARAEPRTPPAPRARLSQEERAARGSALENARWQLREFDLAHAAVGRAGPRAEVLLSHAGWTGSSAGPFSHQRLELRLNDVELGAGVRVGADVTVLRQGERPTSARTFYTQPFVLLVRRLELGFRRADVPFSASLGRTWLRQAVGMQVVDGAQASYRPAEGVEIGAYGGLLPDAAYLTLSPSQWAAGAWGQVRAAGGEGQSASQLHAGARAGWAVRDVLGARAEVAVLAGLWRRDGLTAQAAAEFGFGQVQGPWGVDAARLDVACGAAEGFRFDGGVRYRGLPLTGLTEVGLVSPGQRAVHADAAAGWTFGPGAQVAVRAGGATDFDAGLLQAHAGPEVSFARLGGVPLGLRVGYLEEFGWLRGRTGYVQAALAPLRAFRLLGRGSWFHQQGGQGSEGLAGHELGTSLSLEVTPWRFLYARASLVGRTPLGDGATPVGTVALQVGGAL